jgi:hypothetical protein
MLTIHAMGFVTARKFLSAVRQNTFPGVVPGCHILDVLALLSVYEYMPFSESMQLSICGRSISPSQEASRVLVKIRRSLNGSAYTPARYDEAYLTSVAHSILFLQFLVFVD